MNKKAMDELKNDNFQECHRLLKQTEELIICNEEEMSVNEKRRHHLISITMNNFGCYYKKYYNDH